MRQPRRCQAKERTRRAGCACAKLDNGRQATERKGEKWSSEKENRRAHAETRFNSASTVETVVEPLTEAALHPQPDGGGVLDVR